MATREIRLGSIKGLSSYELAVKSGTFTGTLIEYLNKEQQYYNDMVLYGDALKDELGGIDADTINAIMADAVKYEDFATYDDMEAWLKDAANIGTLRDGDLLLIEDMDVPNYWVLEALEVADEDTGYYYKIAELGDLFGEGSTEIDTTKLVSLDTVSANRFISSGSDVNNYLTVGQYTIAPENVNSILNIPEGASAGDLFVKTMIEDDEDTFHRLQVYMTYDNTGIYTRYIHKDGVDVEIVYGEWQKLATGNDLNNVDVSFDNVALTGTPTAPTADVGTNTEQIATTAFVQSAISNLVDSAPEAMDTLNELATAITEHQDVATALDAAIANKVDKIDGKGLSTNDYTDEDKEKLSNVENVSVDSELSATSTNAIQNKVVASKFDTIESEISSLKANIKVDSWDESTATLHLTSV